jgi:hypothetical protein
MDLLLPSFGIGFLLFGLLCGLLWLAALVGALTSEFREGTTKLVWVLVIIFMPFLGAILWFIMGRQQTLRGV